jgi:hypothetical protein
MAMGISANIDTSVRQLAYHHHRTLETNTYGNTGCGVFKRGIQNYKNLCLRINILKGNYELSFGLMASCQREIVMLR